MAIAKKKKKFLDVEIPLIRKTTQLQAFNIEELEGKFITYDLTRILKGKNMIFQAVVQVKDNKLTAIPRQTKILPSYIKRMVRKGTRYIEDSFSTPAKDSQVRIKPFLVARRKVSRAVRKALREKAKEELIEYAKTKNSQDIFEEVIANTLQKNLSLKLKKIYPLASCEIRIFKVEGPVKKQKPEKKEKKEEEEKTEEPEKAEKKH